MADKYSIGYKARYITKPPSMQDPGDSSGKVRWLYAKYDLGVDGSVLATADTVYLTKLPKGARVLDGWLKHGDLGTGGTVDIGWQASSDGVETADSNGLFAAVDMKTAADALVGLNEVASPPAMFKKFEAEVNVVAVASEASTLTDGDIEIGILYVVE